MNHATETTNEEIIMRETLLVAMLVLSPIAGIAQTAPHDSAASPRFSAGEVRTIDRNELLRAIIAQDPRLVRQILDVMARNGKGGDASSTPALDGIELSKNPDLAPAARTAAGSLELIDLLRRARAAKEALQAKSDPTGRSAVGTVETIEMLRRAQDAKGAQR
jgi:hypothetical protein